MPISAHTASSSSLERASCALACASAAAALALACTPGGLVGARRARGCEVRERRWACFDLRFWLCCCCS